MKAILISIKPKYVAQILNGEKTIEIRKTMPKCDLPIDVYVYCTKEEEVFYSRDNQKWYATKNRKNVERLSNGVVKFKFRCYKVEKITPQMWTPKIEQDVLAKSCLKECELFDYVCSHDGTEDRPFYAIHISDLEIFDKPKELSEFDRCILTEDLSHDNIVHIHQRYKITKAPQNFCYVEKLL